MILCRFSWLGHNELNLSLLSSNLKVDAFYISCICQNMLLLSFDALCSVKQEQTEPCSEERRTAFQEKLNFLINIGTMMWGRSWN